MHSELWKKSRVNLSKTFRFQCSKQHVPGFLNHHDDVKLKGIDLIVCVSVNDAFVMEAWGRDLGVGEKVVMLADGNGDFTRELGLGADRSSIGFGQRSKRYSMVVWFLFFFVSASLFLFFSGKDLIYICLRRHSAELTSNFEGRGKKKEERERKRQKRKKESTVSLRSRQK